MRESVFAERTAKCQRTLANVPVVENFASARGQRAPIHTTLTWIMEIALKTAFVLTSCCLFYAKMQKLAFFTSGRRGMLSEMRRHHKLRNVDSRRAVT